MGFMYDHDLFREYPHVKAHLEEAFKEHPTVAKHMMEFVGLLAELRYRDGFMDGMRLVMDQLMKKHPGCAWGSSLVSCVVVGESD